VSTSTVSTSVKPSPSATSRDMQVFVAPVSQSAGTSRDAPPHETVAMHSGLGDLPGNDTANAPGAAVLPRYRVGLAFDGGIAFGGVVATGSKIGRQGLGVLVGMDVISRGDFATSCLGGQTRFTFRVPSSEHADFTA